MLLTLASVSAISFVRFLDLFFRSLRYTPGTIKQKAVAFQYPVYQPALLFLDLAVLYGLTYGWLEGWGLPIIGIGILAWHIRKIDFLPM